MTSFTISFIIVCFMILWVALGVFLIHYTVQTQKVSAEKLWYTKVMWWGGLLYGIFIFFSIFISFVVFFAYLLSKIVIL